MEAVEMTRRRIFIKPLGGDRGLLVGERTRNPIFSNCFLSYSASLGEESVSHHSVNVDAPL